MRNRVKVANDNIRSNERRTHREPGKDMYQRLNAAKNQVTEKYYYPF